MLLIEKKQTKMEQKKQELYLHKGKWNQYYKGGMKLDIKFHRKERTTLIHEVHFLEYDDHSKKNGNLCLG